MIKNSNALLALWNGCSAQQEEYSTWHTREHVLERLTLPGFLAVRRYVRDSGPLPNYLTIYWLSGREALESNSYLELLQSPSGWSRSMRNGLTDVLRQACMDVTCCGQGIGGSALVKLVRFEPLMARRMLTLTQEPDGAAITGVTLGRFDPELLDLPFDTPSYDIDGVNAFILLEGFDPEMLRRLAARLDELSLGFGSPEPWTSYRLAFLAGQDDAVAPRSSTIQQEQTTLPTPETREHQLERQSHVGARGDTE